MNKQESKRPECVMNLFHPMILNLLAREHEWWNRKIQSDLHALGMLKPKFKIWEIVMLEGKEVEVLDVMWCDWRYLYKLDVYGMLPRFAEEGELEKKKSWFEMWRRNWILRSAQNDYKEVL